MVRVIQEKGKKDVDLLVSGGDPSPTPRDGISAEVNSDLVLSC